jgi:hypothetical protein
MSVSELSKLTFSEFVLFMSEFNKKELDDYKNQLSIAWKSVMWSKAKKFPTLKEVMAECESPDIEKEPQKVEDMASALKLFKKRNSKGVKANG